MHPAQLAQAPAQQTPPPAPGPPQGAQGPQAGKAFPYHHGTPPFPPPSATVAHPHGHPPQVSAYPPQQFGPGGPAAVVAPRDGYAPEVIRVGSGIQVYPMTASPSGTAYVPQPVAVGGYPVQAPLPPRELKVNGMEPRGPRNAGGGGRGGTYSFPLAHPNYH